MINPMQFSSLISIIGLDWIGLVWFGLVWIRLDWNTCFAKISHENGLILALWTQREDRSRVPYNSKGGLILSTEVPGPVHIIYVMTTQCWSQYMSQIILNFSTNYPTWCSIPKCVSSSLSNSCGWRTVSRSLNYCVQAQIRLRTGIGLDGWMVLRYQRTSIILVNFYPISPSDVREL